MAVPEYEVIVVGTGFAATFFLHRYLENVDDDQRILVLERGQRHEHQWQLGNRSALERRSQQSYRTRGSDKKGWRFTVAFGGSSSCWWACVPRMLPEDFEMQTRYGVGRDWPLSYGDLESYYCDAEEMMQVTGTGEDSPVPRSRPYPQRAHRLMGPDRRLKQAFPRQFFVQPSARASEPTDNRPVCCGNGVCTLCPIDAKFTILNEMGDIFDDERVELRLGATVTAVETQAGNASGVRYEKNDEERRVNGDLIVLGANGMFNPHILLRSGIDDGPLGEGLVEQVSQEAYVYLAGLEGYGGSTSITGHGYLHYGGEHRKERAGCLIETWNGNRSAGSRERGWSLTSSTRHDAVSDEVEYRPALTPQTLADGEHSFDKPATVG